MRWEKITWLMDAIQYELRSYRILLSQLGSKIFSKLILINIIMSSSSSCKNNLILFALLLMLSLQALPCALGDVTLDAIAPSEAEVCNSSTVYVVWANVTTSPANSIEIDVKIPIDFSYEANSAYYTINPPGLRTQQNPTENGQWLNWTSIASLAVDDALKIEFNLTPLCNAPSGDCITAYAEYDGGSAGPEDSASILVTKGLLTVTKEPKLQNAGEVIWTIYVDNIGTADATNVDVLDVLGDGFNNVNFQNILNATDGTIISDQPYPGFTTIKWASQTVPTGTAKWIANVTADTIGSCGRNHTQKVTVEGRCDTGCVYSNSSDDARVWRTGTYVLNSYEAMLRTNTLLIDSLESLLKNTTLDKDESVIFLDSFDDLAERQQLGLESFEDIVDCYWYDLDEEERVKLTASFEDLLRRQANITSSNEDLIKIAFCKLDPADQTIFRDRFQQRIEYEELLNQSFNTWLDRQEYLNDTDKPVWESFQESLNDLIARQHRLIASLNDLKNFDCQNIYLTITKEADKTSVQAGDPVEFTFTVTNETINEVKNLTINDTLLGVIVFNDTLVGSGPWEYKRTVKLNCSDCSHCVCSVCNFATASGDIVNDSGDLVAHTCVGSQQVCIIVNKPGTGPVHPG
jgi:uncharacterized repeat protein (TIGR01451 family)